MGPSTPIVLSMSAWASPRREWVTRAVLAFLYLCLGLLILLPGLMIFSEGGVGLSWLSAAFVAAIAVPVVALSRIARTTHGQLREIRVSRQHGEVTVFSDHCRIHYPGVLGEDLVLTADQIGAVCVDDRRPAWAALYWCRFLIAAQKPGSRHIGCLFRPGLPNALQLLAPTAAIPNVAIVFTQRLRLGQATGLGQVGESLTLLLADHDDIESTADLPGARPVDPGRAHSGIFLRVDSADAAREAFASWPASRQVLEETDVPLVQPTPMPSAARKVAGATGFVWLVAAFAVTASAVVTRSWGFVVPVALIPAAIGGLVYQTFRSLRGLNRRPRALAATVAAVSVMLASVVLGLFELREITTFDDPPPPTPTPSYYVPEDPFPSQPTPAPIPSAGTFDPLRP